MGLLMILTLLVSRVLLLARVHLVVLLGILSFTLLYGFSFTGVPVGSVWLPHLTIKEIRSLGDLPEGV